MSGKQAKRKTKYDVFYETIIPELDPRLHDWGERRIPTNDNWHPTFPDGTVEGSVRVLSSTELRICFWGADDTYLELDLPLTLEDYWMWQNWLSNLSYIDKKTLFGLGFGAI